MHRALSLPGFLIFLFLFFLGAPAPACRFSLSYTQHDILTSATQRKHFISDILTWQSKFIHSVGVQSSSGFTCDGQRIDYETGELLPNTKHMFSASSKQSLHLGILAKVFEGNKEAEIIYNISEGIKVLEKKVEAYEDFNRRYPGFGGWLPWVALNNSRYVEPTWDFKNRTPALDNGQMFWASLAFIHAWEKNHKHLNQSLRQRLENTTTKLMLKNLKHMFYNTTTGKIRAVANIRDITVEPENNEYTNDDDYYLDDPYEGELVVDIVTLLSADFTEKQIAGIWADKRNKLKAVNYTIKSLGKNVTVERGFWWSSHEQWKRLFLPYHLSPTYNEIALNGEKVRVWNSNENRINGLYGATTGTANSNSDPLNYYADCGIPSISTQKVEHLEEVTPYGAYPVILINQSIGLAWYHNMLVSPAGQTKYGSVEAVNVTGANVSPMLTWDTKITNVLAILGGTTEIVRDYLKGKGLLTRFVNRVETEYSLAFRYVVGGEVELVGPRWRVREGRGDFATCREGVGRGGEEVVVGEEE